MKSLLLAALLIIFPAIAEAVDRTAASCSQANIQTQIDASSTGDRVLVPAGSCSWTTTSGGTPSVTLNKQITLQGNGIDSTIITDNTGAGFGESPLHATANSYRVTGFTFNANSNVDAADNKGQFWFEGTGWRVDHCKFQNLTGGNGYVVTASVGAGGSAVFDDNTYTDLASTAVFGVGDSDWSNASSIGGSANIFFEGNTYTWGTGFGDGILDAFGGAHIVLRYSTITNTQLGVHGFDSGGYRSTRSWEVYNNSFTNNNSAIFVVMNFRGGTGVIHDNSVSASGGSYNSFVFLQNFRSDASTLGSSTHGICDGSADVLDWSGLHDGNTPGGEGYACADQIGRGQSQALEPTYEWSNVYKGGNGQAVAEGGTRVFAKHIIENRDYYNDTTKPGYSTYACPHPLTGYSGGCDSSLSGTAGYNTVNNIVYGRSMPMLFFAAFFLILLTIEIPLATFCENKVKNIPNIHYHD